MTNPGQHRGWISTTRRGAAAAVLDLVIVIVLGAVATQSAQAQTFTVLHNFTGYPSDGRNPYAALVRDTVGNLYGTTDAGGSGGTSGYGTVFSVDSSGTETVLYNFCSVSRCADGAYPDAALVRNTAGNLYGTTYGGGYSADGTVFKLSKTGTETVLYSFDGGLDGCYPNGGLLRDKAGNLYGTTSECGAYAYGTVFKLSKTGKKTVLHRFHGGSDGAYPASTSLVMDADGNLYGVTEYGGGIGCDGYGCGTVYRLSQSRNLTVLHSFTGGATDGCGPYGTPAMDTKGNLYGTASGCGSSNDGIVWQVSKKGTETVLHNFVGGSSDGAYPTAGVIMDKKGNLYSDTMEGGGTGCDQDGCGTLYMLSKTGTLTLLHSFTGSDGGYPLGELIMDGKRNLYGTASVGGSSEYGTVWQVAP